jgi:hypothetical protein
MRKMFLLSLSLLLVALLAACQKIKVDLAETEEPTENSRYTVSADLNTPGGARK